MSRNAVSALLDEWDRSRREVVALLPRIRAAEFEGGDPNDRSRPRGILIHILSANYGYSGWICDCLGFPRPERRVDPMALSGRDDFQRGFEDVRDYFVRALEGLEDAHLEKGPGQIPSRFKSRWGEDYSIEQMLEHAVCHHLRHRRQLERMPIFMT